MFSNNRLTWLNRLMPGEKIKVETGVNRIDGCIQLLWHYALLLYLISTHAVQMTAPFGHHCSSAKLAYHSVVVL